MPDPAKRAYFVPQEAEVGRHQSFKQKIEGKYSFRVSQSGSAAARLKAYNAITKELQGMIAKAVREGKSLRAQGSSWSLSPVGVTGGRLIDTKALRIGFSLPASFISASYPDDSSRLRFLECGASIDSINRFLFKDGLSLKASGSNNGQTLAGALSTGTHGSAFQFGAIPDFVVGIHLITGPRKHVYLERQSHPITKPRFAERLGAELIRDDTLFNSALVSFGSFGIIHGVMIEARDLFTLNVLQFPHPFNQSLRSAISSLDLTGLSLPSSAASIPKGSPYHFEAIFNPNGGTPPDEATVIVMFEDAWSQGYEPPEWDDGAAGPGAGALDIMGNLIDIIPNPLDRLLVPILNDQVSDQFKPYHKKGIFRDLFRGEKIIGKTLSAGMGVPLSHALDALNVAFDTYRRYDAVLPMLFDVRFVKGTQALLGFTKFETTCVFEIDSLNTAKTRGFLTALWRAMDEAGIPFTLHWGKFNSYLTGPRLIKMYGADAVDAWIASREALVTSPAVRKVFTNPFMRKVGLAT